MVKSVAARTPAPGGGSVAANVAALVSNITISINMNPSIYFLHNPLHLNLFIYILSLRNIFLIILYFIFIIKYSTY